MPDIKYTKRKYGRCLYCGCQLSKDELLWVRSNKWQANYGVCYTCRNASFATRGQYLFIRCSNNCYRKYPIELLGEPFSIKDVQAEVEEENDNEN